MDADYTGRFTTNMVVRNIGHGQEHHVRLLGAFGSTGGADITELPYFSGTA